MVARLLALPLLVGDDGRDLARDVPRDCQERRRCPEVELFEYKRHGAKQ